MIYRTKQAWEIGKQVKVGFLTLTVLEINKPNGDGLPGEYILTNNKGEKYSFIPHNGLHKI